MRTNAPLSHVVTALTGFALGVAAGLLFAPESGEKLRQRLADEAREQLRQAEARLRDLESQLKSLDDRLSTVGQGVSDRVRATAGQARDAILPALDEAAEQVTLEEKEVSRDLRHMTRR
ncbi:MAG: YtxH domain-containing protein [Rhodothermales bacterium]